MEILLFDGPQWETLLPITYTRPVSELKLGYFSIKEKWERITGDKVLINCREELSASYSSTKRHSGIFINASYLPSIALWQRIAQLNDEEALLIDGDLLAYRSKESLSPADIKPRNKIELDLEVRQLKHYWDIFKSLDEAIRLDFELLGASTHSNSEIHATEIIGDDLYIAEDVDVSGAIINSKTGPVIIGKGLFQ